MPLTKALASGVLKKLLCVFFGISLALAIGEAYSRFFADITDSFSFSLASSRWFARHYRNNSYGVRDDRDYAPLPPPGMRRISFAGDSFTAGHGIRRIEDRFAGIIRKKTRGEWEVHVLARNGMDTVDEVAGLRDLLRTGYRLDQVVLIYCLNDIQSMQIATGGWTEEFPTQSLEGFWVRHSFLINTLYYRILVARHFAARGYFDSVKSAYAGEAFDLQKKQLLLFKNGIEAAGGRLAVVTFPFLHHMGPGYEHREAHEKLSKFWKELGVPHLDLLETFAPYGSKELVVSRFDAHPNERAHRLAAEAILPFLRSLPGLSAAPVNKQDQ
ncbi:MAG: SGNH/GDSL hydrolase family protein [Elusimicrobiota bacterium]